MIIKKSAVRLYFLIAKHRTNLSEALADLHHLL